MLVKGEKTMTTQVTITLPDTIYTHVERLATITGKSIADILTTSLELSFPAITVEDEMQAITNLTDEEILALVHTQMESSRSQQLSSLLHRQQAGKLSDTEQQELSYLMQHYQSGLLRKAWALQEAVKRGIHEPINAA